MRAAIERDGYVVARNLLTPAEVERLRAALLAHFAVRWRWEGLGKHQPRAADAIPAIGWIFAHPAIVAVFRHLTGSERPVFTANADAHMNMLSWWHKDTAERQGGCFKGDYFGRGSLGVYRAGIYMQDHDVDGHGLHVRPGSQATPSIGDGRVETLSTRVGDVVFFDPRLSHAGQFPDPVERLLLRAGQGPRAGAVAHRVKEGWRRARGKQAKLSLFFTYGAPNADTEDYCDFEARQRRRPGEPDGDGLAPGLLSSLAAQGVSLNPRIRPAANGA